MKLEDVFAGRHITVSAIVRPASDTAIVSFGHYVPEPPCPLFGEPFLTSLDVTAVFVTPMQNHWWQTSEREAACEAIRLIIRGSTRRITYGASMGGYGALAWAGDIGSTSVVAVTPQTVLTSGQAPLKREWQQAVDEVGILKDCVAKSLPRGATVKLLYDPLSVLDRMHVDWLGARREIQRFPFYFGSHAMLKPMAELGAISATMRGIFADAIGPAEFRKIIRSTRGRSARVYDTAARYNAAKRPAMAERLRERARIIRGA